MSRELLECLVGQPERARQQLIVQGTLLAQSLDDRVANLIELQPGKLCIEVVRRLSKILRFQRFAGVHALLRHLIPARNDDDEHPCPAQGNELDPLQHTAGIVRECEANVPGCARHKVRNAGQ